MNINPTTAKQYQKLYNEATSFKEKFKIFFDFISDPEVEKVTNEIRFRIIGIFRESLTRFPLFRERKKTI
jgi:hypothetical protein